MTVVPAMKLHAKTLFFFSIILVAVALGVAFYSQSIVGEIFKQQIIHNFRIIAEQTESAYIAYVDGLKSRTLGFVTDQSLRGVAESALKAPAGSLSRERSAKEFGLYVRDNVMAFDKTVVRVELVDDSGVVIASTQEGRVGVDAKEEEPLSISNFYEHIKDAQAADVFVDSFIYGGDGNSEPTTRTAVRIFTPDKNGDFRATSGVLIVEFASVNRVISILTGQLESASSSRKTGTALLENYETSEAYFVNRDGYIVTPLRAALLENFSTSTFPGIPQKINSLPVSSCLENGSEINMEYDNYQGIRVLGSSMCLEDNHLVLLLEVQKNEIFKTLNTLIRDTTVGILAMFILGVLIATLFIRRPIARINELIISLERVMQGDFNAVVRVEGRDEMGKLAVMFNAMVESIRKNQKELQESKRQLEEKATLLENDLKEHEKQEKFLEESKRATLNLLEDSWKAKEKLEEEGSKLQTILTSIGDGLILIDNEYKIILINAKALEIFMIPRENAINRDLREVAVLYKGKVLIEPKKWPIEDVFKKKIAVTTTVEENFSITTEGRGTPVPIAFSIAPISGKFSGIVIVFRDVTADRQLDEAKSGFISVASHQLRTPLTSIRWYSEMLLSEDSGPLNETQRDFVQEVHGGAERLYKTVDLLLSISRVEGGKINADRSPIDIAQFTRQILKELTSQVNEKNLALTVEPPASGPVIVWLDEIVLRQVILNILSNSIRYTNNNGWIKIGWTVNDSKGEITYFVSDNGIGIPESQRSRIFSRFFRAENARAEVPDGSGLGLALVKNLVDSWGGKIWFEGNEGGGTTFYFTVPLTTKVA